MGPLEATIHQLSKQVQEKEKECTDRQNYWLKSQNELVQISKMADEEQMEIQETQIKYNVLFRKKLHLNEQYEKEEAEFKEYEKRIRHLQNDMVKVNQLLTKHSSVQAQLEENNLGLEIQFRNKLKVKSGSQKQRRRGSFILFAIGCGTRVDQIDSAKARIGARKAEDLGANH